jgi:hypothetical protein
MLSHRDFARVRNATQTKKPIVKIAKPTKAMICSGLAWASEKAVFGNMLIPLNPRESEQHSY